MDKMSLIVFVKTGHVLGAFTRAAAPEAALEPAEVAGEGIWVRDVTTGERLLTVEPQYLAVETTDRRDTVLLAHRRFVLVDGLPQEQGTSLTGLTLSATTLTLTLPANASEDLEAWVQVEGGPTGDRIVTKVEIPSGQGNTPVITQQLTLAPGDYAILALVPGFLTWISRDTVP